MQSDSLKTFAQGGQDTNSAPEYVEKNDYVESFNTRNSGTSKGETGYITNIESTLPVTELTTVPTGINRAIGSKQFIEINKGISFRYNSAGNNQILVYDYVTDTVKAVYTDLTDSNNIPLLPLDPNFYVNCVLINDTYLIWSDGKNEVGYTNLNTLTNGGYGTVLAEDLSLIKPQPLIPIAGVYSSDAGKASNFVKNKLYQFTPRWTNSDFNTSTWGTWSKRIIPPQESTPTEGTNVSENNCIIVSVDMGSIRVTQLDVACREGLFDFNIIKTVTRDYVVALPNTTIDIPNQVLEAYDPTTNLYSFVFYNQSLTIPVPPTETDQLVDYIPRAATGIEKINGNIVALGDLKVGYDRPKTSVSISSTGYDPNLSVPDNEEPNPLKSSVIYAGGEGSGSNKPNRRMQVNYTGVPHTGDLLKITTISASDASLVHNYSYPVNPAQDGDLFGVVLSFSAQLSGAVTSQNGGYTITFYEDPEPHRRIQSAPVITFNEGATVSKSIHALLDNSSYQFALSYYDKWGRMFPLETDNTFIVNTPSFAQMNGLTPRMSWAINTLAAPVGAVSYQWLITKNTTVTNLLDIFGNLLSYKGGWSAATNSPLLAAGTGTVGDTYQVTTPNLPNGTPVNLGNGALQFNSGDYVSYNGKSWDVIPKSFADLSSTSNVLAIKINPLNLFNQRYTNNGINTVLNYDFSVGDRCTLHYYITPGSINPKTYINNPCVDVDVFGYDPTTFLVKIQKSSSINPATLAGKDILLRLYSPNTQVSTSEVTTDNTTVWYEIGEKFNITNGNHDVLNGSITDGDVYFKTRSYDGAVDPNNIYDILATDFNFSDFYPSNFTSYGRPRTFYDVLETTEQKASIIPSEKYVLGSKNNGLNRFYQENIYGEGDGQTSSSFGAIQVLWQRGNYLVVIQETNTGYIPVNVSELEDVAQQRQYAISEKLLNNIRYNQTGNIGCGTAKESFCYYDNLGWFIDPNRSAPVQIGLDGLTDIGGKMSKYFKDAIQSAYLSGRKLVMYYDSYYKEVVFATQTDGGTLSILAFTPENWQAFDDYVIIPSDITAVTDGSFSTVVNNGNGTATYTPDVGYVGNDVGTFTFNTAGGPIIKNLCLNWIEADTTVNQFSFTPLTAQVLNTLIVSNSILVQGINVPVSVSIVGGQYSVNGGAYTSTMGTVNNNDQITIRQTSANTNGTLTTATLTVSGTSAGFNVTTKFVVVLNYEVTAQANPFADANLEIKKNGVTIVTQSGSGSGTQNILEGDSIQSIATCDLSSTGTTPILNMTIERGVTEIYNEDIPDNEGATLSNTFVAQAGSVYEVDVTGTASGASGYAVVNNIGATVTYNIYDGSNVLTDTDTLSNGSVLNIQTLITGGDNSKIEFVAPTTGDYDYLDVPSGTNTSLGSITSGAVFLDYTVADIATEVGLGNVGRIFKFTA